MEHAMKRKSLLLLLMMGLFGTLNIHPMAAQTNKKDQLAKEGRTIEEVVPNGWDIQGWNRGFCLNCPTQ